MKDKRLGAILLGIAYIVLFLTVFDRIFWNILFKVFGDTELIIGIAFGLFLMLLGFAFLTNEEEKN